MVAIFTTGRDRPKVFLAGGRNDYGENGIDNSSCPGLEPRSGGTYLQGLLIDHSERDIQLLALLLPQAELTAKEFSNAVLARLAKSPIIDSMPVNDVGPLTFELRQWFTNLFHLQTEVSREIPNPKTESKQYSFHLPLSFLLGNLEIILKFGKQVTAQSPQSERAWLAFIRSLSLEFARKQVDLEQRLEVLSNLLLLE